MPSVTSWRMRSVDLQLGQELLGPLEHELDAHAQLGGLEDGQLVVGGGLGPRRGGVGQRTGIAHGAQDLGQAPRPAHLGDLLEHDAQLTAEGLDAHTGPGVGHRLGLDPEARPLRDHARTQAGSLQPADDGGRAPTRELAGVLDQRDDTDVGHASLDLGDEEHPAVGAGRWRRRWRCGPPRSRGRG